MELESLVLSLQKAVLVTLPGMSHMMQQEPEQRIAEIRAHLNARCRK